MASLPTAYASQRFGRKSLDFYAAAGDVIGADPRARSDERRLQDFEGARHTVRLMESGFVLAPGDQASVLRMQPGPARRSRPVAVINHTHAAWSRTHPGVAGLLARAGVARTANWLLTMMLFALAALAAVWPYLRAFLVEIDPSLFGAAPQFDVFALAAGAAPALAEWRLATLTAPLSAWIADIAPGLEAFAPHAAFGAAVIVAAVMVHALRSWRLIWAPVFVAALGAGALGFDGAAGAVTPALAGLGLAASVFLVAGLVNRVRDAARLERRIAVLADHILRNPPEEMVAGAGEAQNAEAQDAAGADADAETEAEAGPAAAAAAAYRAPDDTAEAETVEAQADAEAAAASQTAHAGDDALEQAETSGEDAEAPIPASQGPAAAEQAEGEAGAAEAIESATAARSADEAPPEPADLEAAPEAHAEAPDQAGRDDAQKAAAADGEDPHHAEVEDAPSRFEKEESERLRTDPRYASRAIVLPPPPPMPGAAEDEAKGEAEGTQSGDADAEADATRSSARTLQPAAPLPSNVVPMFAPPAPARRDEEPVD